jgi:hypothetical protein
MPNVPERRSCLEFKAAEATNPRVETKPMVICLGSHLV